MANPHRGEALLTVKDGPYTLRLTLGALAALEARLNQPGLDRLMAHLLRGDLTSSDMAVVLEEALAAGESMARREARAVLQHCGEPLALSQAYVALMRVSFAP